MASSNDSNAIQNRDTIPRIAASLCMFFVRFAPGDRGGLKSSILLVFWL